MVMANGTLYGVGVGPGDPELMSLKAARILGSVPVVVFFSRKGGNGVARSIVEGRLNPAAEILRLDYPFTTEVDAGTDEYRTALTTFYDAAAARLAASLAAGRDVAVLCEGDPFLYGSYAHLHARLACAYPCEVVAGVAAMSGCWTRAGVAITRGDDALTVLSGTMDETRLVALLSACDAAVIMKVGRNLPKIRRALAETALLERAIYVERGTMPEERILPLAQKSDDEAPYFSLVLVPSARVPL
jgi:precorrin-2/cobalt-factor-2 C20-methyltransferase